MPEAAAAAPVAEIRRDVEIFLHLSFKLFRRIRSF